MKQVTTEKIAQNNFFLKLIKQTFFTRIWKIRGLLMDVEKFKLWNGNSEVKGDGHFQGATVFLE